MSWVQTIAQWALNYHFRGCIVKVRIINLKYMEKRKIILTVIGVAVLLVLSIFVFNKKNTSPTVVQQPIVNEPTPVVFKNIVTYKNRLFTPSNFSVKLGVTVSFVNESDED